MPSSILGSFTFGYQLLWNQLRQLTGVQLFVEPVPGDGHVAVDATHLLHALRDAWSEQAPTMIVSAGSPGLLADLLAHTPADGPWIEVDEHLLAQDPALAAQVHQAHQRGLSLVWRGDAGERPGPALRACFEKCMITFTPDEALTGLRVSLHKHNSAGTVPAQSQHALATLKSPVDKGQIYESVASRPPTHHSLDEPAAWRVPRSGIVQR